MTYVIAHTGDLHFGAMDPEVLYDELKRRFIKPLYKLPRLDLIAITGDTLDNLLSLESKHSKYAIRFIYRDIVELAKAKGAKVRVCQGTLFHDRDQLDNFSALENDDEIDFKIFKTVGEEEIFPGFNVLYVPEEYVGDPEEYYREYFKNEGKYKLVLGHGMFREVAFHDQNTEVQRPDAPIFDVEIFNRICVGPILFGHIHIMQQIRNSVFYCGSFSRWAQGEERAKGFLLVLMNAKTNKFVVTPMINDLARVYITKDITGMVSKYSVEELVEKIQQYKTDNNIYKFKLFVTDVGDKECSAKIALLKNFFRGNKEISIEVEVSAVMVKEEDQKKIIEQYNYLFDKSYTESQKLSMFIKDKFQYDISPERVDSLIFSNNDIIQILNKLGDED